MAFAETANLAVKLSLGGNFVSQMGKATKSLQTFDKESRAFKAGAQIGTGIKRGAIIAVAAAGTLTALLAQSVKEGQEAANVQKVYAQAISNSGKVSADYVKILNDQQKALENLGGVDDELIKSEQTRLIQMGLTGKATAALTPLILDASKATGKDLLTVTIAAGKAANGNATALQRLGIMVDKTRYKVDPLAETMRVLNQRFGGTTKALSGSLDVRAEAFRQALTDIREEAGIKLLPVLTRIVDLAGTKLVPAFGKFVDRILPEVNKGLDEFANALENGGAENAIRGITDALGPMIDLVKVAAAPVKAIVGAFLSLPKEVQTVLVGAFAVNKLTGGLVTNAAGGIIEAIGKAFLGGIKAPLVNVEGAVVNVAGGGIPGVPGVPGGGGSGSGIPGWSATAGAEGGIKGLLKGLPIIGLGITGSEIGQVIAHEFTADFPSMLKQAGINAPSVTTAPTQDSINFFGDLLSGHPLDALGDLPKIVDDLGQIIALTNAHKPDPNKRTDADLAEAATQLRNAAKDFRTPKQIAKTNKAQGDQETASQLRNIAHNTALPTPVNVKAGSVSTAVNVSVNVTAGGIQRRVVVHNRYGPATGSRSSDPRWSGYTPGGA